MGRSIRASALALGIAALPALASAQSVGGLAGLISLAGALLNSVIGIMIAVAVVVFFGGLVKYLMSVGEEKSAGLQIMFYGIVAIFVMVSLWGIIRLLQITLGVGSGGAVPPPQVQVPTVTSY